MEKKMNRRELMTAMSIFPFVGKQKVRLDRINRMTLVDDGLLYSSTIEAIDEFFTVISVKETIKRYNEVILEDGNKNVLKVNKLNRGLILLKLDLIK